MTRRAGIALIGAGVATAIPYTRGMTSTVANRLTNVETATDPDALLGIQGRGVDPRDEITVINNAEREMTVTVATNNFEIENGGSDDTWTFSLQPGSSRLIDFAPNAANTDRVSFSADLLENGSVSGTIQFERSISIPTSSNEVYRIRNVNSGLYLTADDPDPGFSWPPWEPADQTGDVYQDSWEAGDDQRWTLVDDGTALLLQHVSSGALLSVGDPNGGNDFEEIVTQDEPAIGGPTDDQRWNLVENQTDNYRIESTGSGDVVDVEGESTSPEANVIAYPWKGEDGAVPNQMWTFEPL